MFIWSTQLRKRQPIANKRGLKFLFWRFTLYYVIGVAMRMTGRRCHAWQNLVMVSGDFWKASKYKYLYQHQLSTAHGGILNLKYSLHPASYSWAMVLWEPDWDWKVQIGLQFSPQPKALETLTSLGATQQGSCYLFQYLAQASWLEQHSHKFCVGDIGTKKVNVAKDLKCSVAYTEVSMGFTTHHLKKPLH